MKVVISTLGRFHSFDLARELDSRGQLECIFTGYPVFKLGAEGVPKKLIRSFPWVHGPYMATPQRHRLGDRLNRAWEYLDKRTLDRYVCRSLPPCDVFVGLSGSSLLTGRRAKANGARYVCDRGSTHIREQDELMRQEHARWQMPYRGIDPRVIDLEEAEYADADCITVPSQFNLRSFVARGIATQKLRQLAYGVNLQSFHPTCEPSSESFDILFVGAMGLRKGVPYLLQAYRLLAHPKKSLTFAGSPDPAFIALMKHHSIWPNDARVLGHVPQREIKHLMSRSHVLALPSIEEGLAMVQAQALACGCPVIGTAHSGAEDLFQDGVCGFIVPVRDATRLRDRLQLIADDAALGRKLRGDAVAFVHRIGGWRDYGERASLLYSELAA